MLKKYKKGLLVILILYITSILIGCKNKELGDNYVSNEDAQYMFMQSTLDRYIAKSDSGYYFANGLYIYYADKETMQPVILCDKPNCLHDKETDPYKKQECNAFIGSDLSNKLFAIYEDYIYYYGINEKDNYSDYIFRISLDGNEKKAITKVEGNVTMMTIHRGKLYYSTYEDIPSSEKKYEGEKISKLIEYDFLKPYSKPNVIKEFKNMDGGISYIIPFGNRVYFNEYTFDDSSYGLDSTIQIYDIKNKKIDKLYDHKESIYTIFKDKIIFATIKEENGEYKRDPHVYICDLDGDNKKLLFNQEILENFYSDNKYIYFDNARLIQDDNLERLLTVMNEDGEVIDKININEVKPAFTFIGSDGENLFVKYEDEEKSYIKYIDINKVGTGQAKLETLFEIEKAYMDSTVIYKK
ncbi:hypothetical protein [uncultured Clostridium sp.]|uniref:hypothetical protein n=1 Tax=uncultured Clostridium sp. TaxID=59620 RepID=UPI0025860640|nr:hypothetical protein [uncultured Clostridium sp.]